MTNIFDLTNVIRDERSMFQARIIDANETKKEESKNMKANYIPGSPGYAAKTKEIEEEYTKQIIAARQQFAETVTNEIESLKAFEVARVQRIDQGTMHLLNSLQNIPLSESELKIVMEKHATSSYWAERAVSALADINGIAGSDLGLPSSIDTKFSVLDQLSDQLDKVIKDFDEVAKTPEAAKARFLYLNDDVLQNASEIYTNSKHDESAASAATKAYYKIKATSGDMARGITISNALRNIKSKDARNIFLSRLASDETISKDSFEVAGIGDIIGEWKNGKNERFMDAMKIANKVSTMKDAGTVREHLQGYADQISNGARHENEFLPGELKKANKKNSNISQAIQEMGDRDRSLFAWENKQQIDNT